MTNDEKYKGENVLILDWQMVWLSMPSLVPDVLQSIILLIHHHHHVNFHSFSIAGKTEDSLLV